MNLRSGDIDIAGTDASVVRVTCDMKSDPREVHISFAADHLTIRGGPDTAVRFRIEIPRSMNLVIRCRAGNLTLEGVTGDKDVKLNAGNLTIAVGDAGSYRRAEGRCWQGIFWPLPSAKRAMDCFAAFARIVPPGAGVFGRNFLQEI